MGYVVSGTLPSPDFWRGKKVFLTGHTGFKGGWLALWLSQLGAVVRGYALAPNTAPNFFTLCGVAELVEHQFADIRDEAALTAAVLSFQPDIIFHLAAQPLVRASYAQPLETYATNIMGTANLLSAAAQTPNVGAVLIVTSDKVYAEGSTAHTETSRLGGHDPYSASKACAELVTSSFPTTVKRASLRAGNVVGGGDWSADRLLPDFFRAILRGEALKIRNPHAIRPWQHVLDPLCGYLLAAEAISTGDRNLDSWNFGPRAGQEANVQAIAEQLCALWPGANYDIAAEAHAPHEAPILRLDATKAERDLGWHPRWDIHRTLTETSAWYQRFSEGANLRSFSLTQIEDYCQDD